jgi:hypothetical protein
VFIGIRTGRITLYDILTWNTRSIQRPAMKATFKLEKPVAQKPLGIEEESEIPAATESAQSWPPLSHSHWMLLCL